ncbi:MAG: AAA family ATPase [Gemmatimonadetes bacterium]|nr:AAA family ATPase [Gemmatimonadota bacterium]NNF13749.1 AAA family ATPase [Gemmatimonadota bacterium]
MSLPLVVEFIGPPGAGKTAVAHEVIEHLEGEGYRCFGHSKARAPESIDKKSGGIGSKLTTLVRFAVLCLSHRRLTVAALRYTQAVRPRDVSGLRRLFILLSRFGFVRDVMAEGYDFVILDQGPLQNIWSIGTTGDVRPADRELLRVVRSVVEDLAPIVVLVEVDADLASERIATRPTMRSRFDRMSRSEASESLAQHEELFRRLFELAGRVGSPEGVRIDGSRPIARNADRLLPLISRARQTHAR